MVTSLKFKETKSSKLQKSAGKKNYKNKFEPKTNIPFKMKKFEGVQSKIEMAARAGLKAMDQNTQN